MKERFVCVFGRNRDNYDVPVALFEARLLDRLVTDFYYDGSGRWPTRLIPEKLKNRWHPKLPKSATTNTYLSFFLQLAFSALKLPLPLIYPTSDRILGMAATFRAYVSRSHVYSYAGYTIPTWVPRSSAINILFQYHPHPAYMHSILKSDFAAHPEVAWSFENEEDSSADTSSERYSDWKRADFVVCASTTTKQSLLFAGCDEARISVIPYGFDRVEPRATHAREASTECRFLFVGQGIQRKGLHHLIKAWNSANLSDAHLTLVCYRIDPGIEQLIDPTQRVTLLRRQSSDELARLYRESDVFVMPSLIEGFGLVYLEALQSGCFIIGTGNTGLSDLDLPADCCDIVEAGDISAIRAALMRVRTRHASGHLDRTKISQSAGRRSGADFRRDIAEHARSALASSWTRLEAGRRRASA